MTVLKDLLAIKQFRENKAEMAVLRQRGLLEEAVRAYEQAVQELEDFRHWAIERERALFDDLCARTVRLRDIQDVQATVSEMRGQEVEYVQVRDQSDDSRKHEESELVVCKDALNEASRLKEKFVELARAHAQEQLRELERKEDAEMEEVAETRRDRVDWDEFTEEHPT